MKNFTATVAIIGLSLLISPHVARAQSARSTITSAYATLNSIDKLIDSLKSRSSGKPIGAVTEGPWRDLFDGKTLNGWKKTDFAGGGGVRVEPNFRGGAAAIVVAFGATI
ncbi:MAG: hypothetical protein ABJA67_13920, partial [Chthonomonadales bacterium]